MVVHQNGGISELIPESFPLPFPFWLSKPIHQIKICAPIRSIHFDMDKIMSLCKRIFDREFYGGFYFKSCRVRDEGR
jgi:hypothetical protein